MIFRWLWPSLLLFKDPDQGNFFPDQDGRKGSIKMSISKWTSPIASAMSVTWNVFVIPKKVFVISKIFSWYRKCFRDIENVFEISKMFSWYQKYFRDIDLFFVISKMFSWYRKCFYDIRNVFVIYKMFSWDWKCFLWYQKCFRDIENEI